MAINGLGLGDVLGIAMARVRVTRPVSTPSFGAAGESGVSIDKEMSRAIGFRRSISQGPRSRGGSELSPDPMTRMFGTKVGPRVARDIGNEGRTLNALQRLSLEVMAEALRISDQIKNDDRLLVIPGETGRAPVLMVMSPRVASADDSRIISDEANLPLSVLQAGLKETVDATGGLPEVAAFWNVMDGGAEALAELFLISQPEIVLTRRPRMIPLCVPLPHAEVQSQGMVSTVGVFCLDADGEFGVTACFHGTGPVGTPVTVLRKGSQVKCASQVKRASQVQDMVFIPLSDRSIVGSMIGVTGVRQDREPARADYARFDGATNQNRSTRIFSTDTGLLRSRPTIMLKLQTDPDTDQGDSGCALRDDGDRVMGFAFERTAYDDYPQFTDWIWAANALRALELTPYTGA